MHQNWRHRLLGAWAQWVSRHPVWVLAVTGLLAALSLLITLMPVTVPGTNLRVGPLGFQSNRNDLISSRLDWNKRFIQWQQSFPGTWDYIVVIDVGPDGPQRADQAVAARKLIDELGPALAANPWVKSAVWGFDSTKVNPKALRLESLDETKPTDPFRQRLADISQATVLASSPTPQRFIAQTLAELRAQENEQDADEAQAARGLQDFAQLLGAMEQVVGAEQFNARPMLDLIQQPQWIYLVSENQRLYFLRVTPRHAEGELNALAPSIAAVRQVMEQVSAKYPQVQVGITGIDVVETDETAVVDWDGKWTGALTGILMLGLLVLAFHSWRTPLMIMASLAVAIAWTFGFATLAVGHLQVISVIFVPLLLGLGIAYGIYLAARLEMIRHDYPDDAQGFAQAMASTLQTMGPGIITGCITTAAAFVMTLFTDFTGVAEMGLIAAVGVGLCLLSMVSVFPALVRLIKPSHRHFQALSERRVHIYDDRWFMPFARHPVATLVIAGVLTGASLLSLIGMRFDYNLLKLQAAGMDSVEWERRIVEDGGESIWFGVSIVKDMQQARELAAQYRRKPTVGLVRGVGLLIPEDEARKVELLRQVKERIDQAVDRAKTTAPMRSGGLMLQLKVLEQAFASQSQRSDIPPSLRPAVEAVGQAIEKYIGTLEQLSPQQSVERLQWLDRAYTQFREQSLVMIGQALDPSPMGLDDLPPEILSSYRGQEGQLSLEIFPSPRDPKTGQTNDALEPVFLKKFMGDLRQVDPQVTGVIVQVYESGTLIQRSYVLAGALGLVVVFVLVWLDFQRLSDALLSLLPVVVGFAVTFGVMRLLGQMINPANIVVLPLMFGIGVDSGVHMIYRWRMDGQGQPPGLTQGTGKGIVIVNLATLIGFGVMMLAHHRGMQGLGQVLTIGMGMTLLACLTVMPACLELRNRRAMRRSGK